ncbi:MAG: tripartite tricarboxylate transporter TctB family protein [Limibaculum sp.]
MRRAELVMGIVMAAFSLYLMWKSMELPVGWIPKEGPGGGAFSFWLAAGMFLSCVAIVVRWFRRTSPLSQSEAVYMDRATVILIATVAGSLTVMIGLMHIIGTYFAVPLFMIFYMRGIGRHAWPLTAAIAAATPVFLFLFFEILLQKTLPKGFSEPLFLPLYEFFY